MTKRILQSREKENCVHKKKQPFPLYSMLNKLIVLTVLTRQDQLLTRFSIKELNRPYMAVKLE